MIVILASGTRHATSTHRDVIRLGLLDGLDLAGKDDGEGVLLIHGGAKGSDTIAAQVAAELGWATRAYVALWDGPCTTEVPERLGGCAKRPHRQSRTNGSTWCPMAGPRRNQQMIDEGCPAVGVMFPAVGDGGWGGTWDCIHRAADAGVELLVRALVVAVEPRAWRPRRGEQ